MKTQHYYTTQADLVDIFLKLRWYSLPLVCEKSRIFVATSILQTVILRSNLLINEYEREKKKAFHEAMR
jgi:hypothetical protein